MGRATAVSKICIVRKLGSAVQPAGDGGMRRYWGEDRGAVGNPVCDGVLVAAISALTGELAQAGLGEPVTESFHNLHRAKALVESNSPCVRCLHRPVNAVAI